MVPKVSNISQILHAISSIDNRIRYSFDTIDIKGIYDKIKTLDRDFKMDLYICNKKEVVDIDKKFNCLWLRFSQTIDVSNRTVVKDEVSTPLVSGIN